MPILCLSADKCHDCLKLQPAPSVSCLQPAAFEAHQSTESKQTQVITQNFITSDMFFSLLAVAILFDRKINF